MKFNLKLRSTFSFSIFLVFMILQINGFSQAITDHKPTENAVSFSSNPSGAVVSLDGKQIGKTPFQAKISNGKHKISFRLKGYQNHIDFYTISDQNKKIQVVLEENVEVEIDLEDEEGIVIDDFLEVEEDLADNSDIFVVAESMPEFPGGQTGLYKFLANNIVYPTMARETGNQGRVFVTFVIEKNGSITDIKIRRGIGGGCDEEAIRVVKEMPKWKPGKQRGKPVRVQFNLPIKFTLQAK
jgi:TonB family protein